MASAFSPDWSVFINPDLLVVFFNLQNEPKGRHDALLAKVRREFSALRVSCAKGRAIVEFGPDGKVVRMPAGAFVNDALRATANA